MEPVHKPALELLLLRMSWPRTLVQLAPTLLLLAQLAATSVVQANSAQAPVQVQPAVLLAQLQLMLALSALPVSQDTPAQIPLKPQ